MRQISSSTLKGFRRGFLSFGTAGLPIILSACAFHSSSAPLGPYALAERLSPILRTSQEQGVRWGVVISTRDGKVLFSRNATGRFIPASNAKLFTTAAAMADLAELERDEATHPTALLLAPHAHGAPDLILSQLFRLIHRY